MDQEDVFWQNPDNIQALERVEMAALRATTVSDMPTFSLRLTQHSPSQSNEDHTLGIKVSDMPSFSLGFTQDSPSQHNEDNTLGDQGPVTPAPQGANRGLQLGDLPTERQRSPAPPLVRLADRKGKRPLNQEPRPFHLVFSPSRGYLTVPIPPIYMVWMWVFNCPNTSRDEVLFRHNDRIATWSDFRTLQEGANVSTAVVDAWSTVLNAREKSRGWGAPSRLFASTTTTVCISILALQFKAVIDGLKSTLGIAGRDCSGHYRHSG
nr:uncharacterized protein LOC109157732 isoform X3 [Ipomoea batatas]